MCVVFKGLVLVVCVFVWYLKDWLDVYVCVCVYGIKRTGSGCVCCVCMCVWYLKDWFWLCVWLERRELVHIARSIYCQY